MTYPRGIPMNNYHYPVYNAPQFQPHPMFANRQPLPIKKEKTQPHH